MESKEDKSVVIADRITLVLEIIGWGLIGAVIFFVLLKVLGLIHSPQEITLDTVLTTGILVLLIEMRVKLGLLWDEKSVKDFERQSILARNISSWRK